MSDIKENYWHGWRPGWGGGWRGRGWRGWAPRWTNYPLSYSYPVYQEVPVQVPVTTSRLGDAVVSPSSNGISNMNPILLIIGLIVLIMIIVKLMIKS